MELEITNRDKLIEVEPIMKDGFATISYVYENGDVMTYGYHPDNKATFIADVLCELVTNSKIVNMDNFKEEDEECD